MEKRTSGPPLSGSIEAAELRQQFWDAQSDERTPDSFRRDDDFMRDSTNLLRAREQANAMTHDFAPDAPTMDSLYESLDVTSSEEAEALFEDLDQAEMKSGNYDYRNNESLLNKIKNHLEAVDPGSLSEEEAAKRDEMLWLWNHHAAGMALLGHRDHEASQQFVDKALKHMSDGHTNKITGLLYFLSRGDVEGAKKWQTEEVGEAERAAAEATISSYEEHVAPKSDILQRY